MNKPAIVGALAAGLLVVSPGLVTADTGAGKGSPGSAGASMMAAPAPPAMAVQLLSMSGTVATVYALRMQFSCHCGTGDYTFPATASTAFTKGTAPATFASLKAGAAVTIQYHYEGTAVVTDTVVIAP